METLFMDKWPAKHHPPTLSTIRSLHKNGRAFLFFEMAILVVLMALLNFWPHKIGVLAPTIGVPTIGAPAGVASKAMPIIMNGFTQNLLWINVWLGLALGFSLMVLICGRRNISIKGTAIGINILGIAILGLILTTTPLVSLNPSWVVEQQAAGISVDWIEKDLVPLLALALTFSLTLASIALFVATGQKALALLGDLTPTGVTIE